MNNMDYEKKYKETVEKLRYKISDNNGNIDYKAIVTAEELQDIFPELKESEDERTRKQILNYFVAQKVNEPQPVLDSWIAWLEKQSKNSYFLTPEESLGISSDKYNDIIDECIFGDQRQVDGFDAELNALLKKYEHLPKEELAECLSFYLGVVQGEQKPKWSEGDENIISNTEAWLDTLSKWTEEDEELWQRCCDAVAAADYYTLEDKEEIENWLKSLKKRMEE